MIVPQSPSQLCLLESVSCLQTPGVIFPDYVTLAWSRAGSLQIWSSHWVAGKACVYQLTSLSPSWPIWVMVKIKSTYLKGLPVRVKGESSSKALGIVPDTPE